MSFFAWLDMSTVERHETMIELKQAFAAAKAREHMARKKADALIRMVQQQEIELAKAADYVNRLEDQLMAYK